MLVILSHLSNCAKPFNCVSRFNEFVGQSIERAETDITVGEEVLAVLRPQAISL
jgi:hypothetical protein